MSTSTLTATQSQTVTPQSPPKARRRKILWLAVYPYQDSTAQGQHPVPWISSLAAALVKEDGIDLTILSWEPKLTQDVEEFDRNGIHFIYLRTPPTRKDILSLYRLRIGILQKYLRERHKEYDLIHIHGSEWQLPSVASFLERPTIMSVQGLVTECVRYVPKRLSILGMLWTLSGYYERLYLPDVHHFICRTHWDKAQIARLSPGAHIHHNWEMMRPEFYPGVQPAAPAPADGRPRLLFTGGTQIMKGFHETLRAYAILRQRTNLKLVLAGRVTPDDIAKATQELGLPAFAPDDVEYAGFCDGAQLATLMQQALCLLHPSYIDNSPNTVSEAQLIGLPVVASEVGGVSSLIEHDRTGLLSTLEPEQLAAQVQRLHDSPELCQALRQEAQRLAAERHAPAAVLQRTLDIYDTICLA